LAGRDGKALAIAAFFAMLARRKSAAGPKYAEAAAELEAQLALIAAERAQLESSPQEEMSKPVALHEAQGP